MNGTLPQIDMTDVSHILSNFTEPDWIIPRLGLLVAVLVTYVLSRTVLLKITHMVVRRTSMQWDDLLIQHQVFKTIVVLLPGLVLLYGSTLMPEASGAIRVIVAIWVVWHLVLLVNRMLSVALDVYETKPISARRPLKGHIQLLKMFVYIVGAVLVFSLLMDQSPWTLLSGIGALTAVLLIVFRDTILSFVASMQVAANDVFRRGDWVDMPAYNADGEVIDVALHVVKVRNWDKTVVSIPTHKFLDNAVRNWRAMQEAGGRRIKRSVLLDQSSIHFLSKEEKQRLQKIDLLYTYMQQKELELEEYNRQHHITPESPVNGRRQTNIGALRAYLNAYLKEHPRLRQDLTMMVRQLQPTGDGGLPLEVYCFTATTAWVEYETIQADIFDHVLAVLPEFGLRVYQRDAFVDGRVALCGNGSKGDGKTEGGATEGGSGEKG